MVNDLIRLTDFLVVIDFLDCFRSKSSLHLFVFYQAKSVMLMMSVTP